MKHATYKLNIEASGVNPKSLDSCIDFVRTISTTLKTEIRSANAYITGSKKTVGMLCTKANIVLDVWNDGAILNLLAFKKIPYVKITKAFYFYIKPSNGLKTTFNSPKNQDKIINMKSWT